jgi:hypothetical protein
VEVYTPGLANTMIKINSRGLTNVRVVEANAPEVLATMLPPGSVSELWVFFPDPWHKSRHHKRRLIQPEFAELAAKALKPGGLWRIATDWSNYAVHVRDVLAGSEAFENLHNGERSGPESPLTHVWQTGVESLVGGAPVKEGTGSREHRTHRTQRGHRRTRRLGSPLRGPHPHQLREQGPRSRPDDFRPLLPPGLAAPDSRIQARQPPGPATPPPGSRAAAPPDPSPFGASVPRRPAVAR